MIGIGYASPYRYGPAKELIPLRRRLDDIPGSAAPANTAQTRP